MDKQRRKQDVNDGRQEGNSKEDRGETMPIEEAKEEPRELSRFDKTVMEDKLKRRSMMAGKLLLKGANKVRLAIKQEIRDKMEDRKLMKAIEKTAKLKAYKKFVEKKYDIENDQKIKGMRRGDVEGIEIRKEEYFAPLNSKGVLSMKALRQRRND